MTGGPQIQECLRAASEELEINGGDGGSYLTDAQRALIAAKVLQDYGDGHITLNRDSVIALTRTSGSSLIDAEAILKAEGGILVDAVKEGRVSLSGAAEIADRALEVQEETIRIAEGGKHRSLAKIAERVEAQYQKAAEQARLDRYQHRRLEARARGHRLIHGDATDHRLLDEESVDLIVTSPPYNIGKDYNSVDDEMAWARYRGFTDQWLRACYVWARENARLCLNVSIDTNKGGKHPLTSMVTQAALDAGWKYHATVIWNEGNISRRTAWGSWLSASAPHIIAPVETIIVLYKGDWKRGKQSGETTIERDEFKEWVLGHWTFNGESRGYMGREATFPLELPRRCIRLLSFKDDVVLDPFVGSGTTMVAAINQGRTAIGIELDKEAYEITMQRVREQCELELED